MANNEEDRNNLCSEFLFLEHIGFYRFVLNIVGIRIDQLAINNVPMVASTKLGGKKG